MEDYFFDIKEAESDDRFFVLIIYDIIDNSRRQRLAKMLQGYGFRIQKSAFEATLKKNVYNKLLRELRSFSKQVDSIRVYKIIGKGQVINFGKKLDSENSSVVIV